MTGSFNLQLSYGSSSPVLSDRNRFPNFFRVTGPDQNLTPAKLALMKEFNWKKVATINQALEMFSVVGIMGFRVVCPATIPGQSRLSKGLCLTRG